MYLKEVYVKNFRCFRGEHRMCLSDMNVLVGRNDAGKSAIMEALEIFFNSDIVKIDKSDLSVSAEDQNVMIGCSFAEAGPEIVIDDRAKTTVQDEYILDKSGDLQILKEWNFKSAKPRESVFIVANHPTAVGANDLLTLPQTELRKRIESMNLQSKVEDQRVNGQMRKAIWESFKSLELSEIRIQIDAESTRNIWNVLSEQLPLFRLFRSDRSNSDADDEFQDPMGAARDIALKSSLSELKIVEQKVREGTQRIADRTLAILKKISPDVAATLRPDLSRSPAWGQAFKFQLISDNAIQLNKRGSGIRRLVLLSFLMAESEESESSEDAVPVIYAIEEPETALHPALAKQVLKTLQDLSERDDRQVLITSHIPGFVGEVSRDCLRLVTKDDGGVSGIAVIDDASERQLVTDLGIYPDNRVKVVVCVEGKNDIEFLTNISETLNAQNPHLPSLRDNPKVVLIPLGGSSLKHWAQRNPLEGMRRPEVHLYDRGNDNPPKYEEEAKRINDRGGLNRGFITSKNEIENYIHPHCIQSIFGIEITSTDETDVPATVAKAVYERVQGVGSWGSLDADTRKKKESRVKDKLNREAAKSMTAEQIAEMDPKMEVNAWLTAIRAAIDA